MVLGASPVSRLKSEHGDVLAEGVGEFWQRGHQSEEEFRGGSGQQSCDEDSGCQVLGLG